MLTPLFSAQQLLTSVGESLDVWGQIHSDHSYAISVFQGMPVATETSQRYVAFLAMISCLDSLLDIEVDKKFPQNVLEAMKEAVENHIPAEVLPEVLEGLGMLRRSTLRTQLQKFISHLPHLLGSVAVTQDYMDWTLGKIIASRNCAAHSAPKDCEKAATGFDLVAIDEFVRMLVNARILELLGFSSEQLSNQFKDSFGFGTVQYLDMAWKVRP